jgi:hypothetical protein
MRSRQRVELTCVPARIGKAMKRLRVEQEPSRIGLPDTWMVVELHPDRGRTVVFRGTGDQEPDGSIKEPGNAALVMHQELREIEEEMARLESRSAYLVAGIKIAMGTRQNYAESRHGKRLREISSTLRRSRLNTPTSIKNILRRRWAGCSSWKNRPGRRDLKMSRNRFGGRVAKIVKACSDSLADTAKGERKAHWHERKEAYIARSLAT